MTMKKADSWVIAGDNPVKDNWEIIGERVQIPSDTTENIFE